MSFVGDSLWQVGGSKTAAPRSLRRLVDSPVWADVGAELSRWRAGQSKPRLGKCGSPPVGAARTRRPAEGTAMTTPRQVRPRASVAQQLMPTLRLLRRWSAPWVRRFVGVALAAAAVLAMLAGPANAADPGPALQTSPAVLASALVCPRVSPSGQAGGAAGGRNRSVGHRDLRQGARRRAVQRELRLVHHQRPRPPVGRRTDQHGVHRGSRALDPSTDRPPRLAGRPQPGIDGGTMGGSMVAGRARQR